MNTNSELISQYDPELKETDPELVEILDNFITNQVDSQVNIDNKIKKLTILATLITNQSHSLYEHFLVVALQDGISPVAIKEILYQTIPYVGLSKCYSFIDITNNIFDERGIDLPLPGQTTTTQKNRKDEGYNIQADHYGKEWIDQRIDDTSCDQKHVWDFISAFAFGDFYTRTGLSHKEREIITYAILISLRGCEDQLEIHIKGNLKVGNTKKDMIDVVTLLIPYIGFPRMHNALKILNKVA